jgi:hypothetical protein
MTLINLTVLSIDDDWGDISSSDSIEAGDASSLLSRTKNLIMANYLFDDLYLLN